MQKVNWDKMPQTCKTLPQWVLWKSVLLPREGKLTKRPFGLNGKSASSTDPKTWCGFDEAKRAVEGGLEVKGVGFVFTLEAGITGIDLDHCRDPQTGEIDLWAQQIVQRFNSYTEISPSGAGVHILIRGKLPEDSRHKKTLKDEGYRPNAAIEVYNSGRYFTMTGNRLDGYPVDVEDRQTELDAFCKELSKDRPTAPQPTVSSVDRPKMTDEAVIAKMLSSVHGAKIKRLMEGDISEYGNDHSAADQALCNYLAFFTDKNRQQMDRIFRTTKLWRPKWDEKRGNKTYGELTIDKAITDTTEGYQPERSNPTSVEEPQPEEYPERAVKAGNNILQKGKVLKFLLQQFHKNHVGDDVAGKVLILSYVSGSSLTGNGIQPGITGDAQTGKSDAMDSALHILPQQWIMKTGLSDKAAVYTHFQPGHVIHSDDLNWTDGLTQILKVAMSNFQTGSTYTTVMKEHGKHVSVSLPIQPRLLWWLTGFEAPPDDQIESRQYPVDVDQSEKHALAVQAAIVARRAKGKPKFEVDLGIQTARYILEQIRLAGPFKVDVPFAGWINYKLPKDYRGLNQFLDLIDALAILHFKQRAVEGNTIKAELRDFYEAKAIFCSKNESHITGLTKAELQLITAMLNKLVWTQADLVRVTGKAQSTVSRRLESIMKKTSYIMKRYDRDEGETVYMLNNVDLKIFSNVVIGWKKAPTRPAFSPIPLPASTQC